ncbi:hypothetical protein [Uliginosibacterium sp. TH139]|uniref:DUF6980 family protein n=1 Tax=Uliginosibacterium sp. TH139 TaxID=2067453 RepID=UPI000C795907|nr:hypothetical protein C0V76_14765 [Uliginosibacterium sp. TH139]
MKHCCEAMTAQIERQCDVHSDQFSCPDALISYFEKFDEYGIIIHDGGSAVISIEFCPLCGTKLPESKRDRWFNELEAMGFDDPSEQDIPEKYHSSKWYR